MNDLKAAVAALGGDAATFRELLRSDGRPIFGVGVHGSEAIALWGKIRANAGELGTWPVLIGDDEALSRQRDHLEMNNVGSVVEILEHAATIDAEQWLLHGTRLFEDEILEPDVGDWPDGDHSSDEFRIPYDVLSHEPYEMVWLALVPTVIPWQIPAILRYGAWNDCPEPAVHVAAMKYWRAVYGAEVVGMSSDVVEMKVSRPPDSRDAALRLARQQYAYCYDIVEQGTNTLSNLAACLLNGTAWYFWWD